MGFSPAQWKVSLAVSLLACLLPVTVAGTAAGSTMVAAPSLSAKVCHKKVHGKLKKVPCPTPKAKPAPAPKPAPTPPAPPPPALGTRSNPYPLGQSVPVGSAVETTSTLVPVWQVRVNSSIPNGDAQVAAENEFNDPPPAGSHFFIVNVTITYIGTGQGNLFDVLEALALVGNAGVVYQNAFCGVVPDELGGINGLPISFFSGGSVTGNICQAVPASDAPSVLLFWHGMNASLTDWTIFFKVS